MDIIMLALIILAAIITVPTLMYLWIRWYYNELDGLFNYGYDTKKSYIIANLFGIALLFGACVCTSWLILDPSSDEDVLFGQIILLALCIIIDLVVIITSIQVANYENEFDEYKDSFIYIVQFIFIIPISIYLLVLKLINFIKNKN